MNFRLAACVALMLIGCSSGGNGGTGGGSGTGGGTSGTGGGSAGTGGGTSGTGGGTGGSGGSGGGTVEMPVPTELIGLSVGWESACAVLANKTAKCWGRGDSGQLGNGADLESATPVLVTGLTTVEEVSVGYEHACARLTDGTARCWGSNGNGQLGDNSKNDSNVPVTVMGLSGVASIHAGVYTTCARLTGGTVSCWGRGGDLGENTTTESLVPRAVPNLTGVTQLSVTSNGGYSFPIQVCGIRTGGIPFCWGNGASGALGTGDLNSYKVPVNVVGPGDAGITDATEIAAAGTHGCMKRATGVSCWGFSQEVGDDTVNQSNVAVPINTTTGIAALSAGSGHTLARTSTNNLLCWGRSGRGQCGDSAAFTPGGPIYLSPIAPTTMNVSLFSAGGDHSCAYQPGPKVTWCWGATAYGQLGFTPEVGETRTSVPVFVRW